MAFEPRIRACFEIKALSPQEGWLPFKDLATQRSEQERVRGDVKTMRDRLLARLPDKEPHHPLLGEVIAEIQDLRATRVDQPQPPIFANALGVGAA